MVLNYMITPCNSAKWDDTAGFQLPAVKRVEHERGIVESKFLVLNYEPLIYFKGKWYCRAIETITSCLVVETPNIKLATSFDGLPNIT